MDIHTLASTPGKDYPQTWNEFLDWFATKETCLAYLERLRWLLQQAVMTAPVTYRDVVKKA